MREDIYETAEDLIESWDEAYSQQENGRTTAFDAPRLQPLLWVDTSTWDSTRARRVNGRYAIGFRSDK
jgi:hypothetical protein